MKQVSLSGSPRENVGKKDAAKLRKEGRVPAVLYGGGDQTHFHISEIDAKKLYYTPNVYVIDLDIDGKATKAIIQEVQLHPVTDAVVHIDFLEVFEDKPVKVKLPVKLTGFSIGVRNGGKLRQHFRRVTAVGLLKDLPEEVELDISPLKIGHKRRISDLSVDGVQFVDAASAVVVAVQMARGAVEEEEEEGEEGAAEGEEGAAEATE
ncbi:50S ribosomal protein L25 [Parvicella tangerina]|uniref:Large ribosomal subunit protein bL25 n=1 Tax=Parvicella tangerina TaxID=2829795 RepID=A0A916JL20_9FLAO|nr:50S ribosomal protein L25 [Parvicella tangerina]CAG5078617.1 General stress protein CTC [Parvicella tangerina]